MTKVTIEKEGPYLFIRKEGEPEEETRRFNLRLKELEKKGKSGLWFKRGHDYHFFKGITLEDLKIKDTKFEKMIKMCKHINHQCSSVSTFLTRLAEIMHLEPYLQEGIDFEIQRWHYGNKPRYTIKMPLTKYTKEEREFIKEWKITVTTEIERKKEDFPETFSLLVRILKERGYNNKEEKEELLRILTDYSFIERVKEVHTRHGCNVKSVVNYILNYLYPFEGLRPREAIRLLNDYLNMARAMDRKVKKYPKYLKSVHDIIQLNYNSHKREYDERRFQELAKVELEEETKEFLIKVPRKTKEIIQEGTRLNHCVSSYVDQILSENTYIFFLRKEKDTPLITLELKKKAIVQAKGAYNRGLTTEEKAYLEKYAKRKKLEVRL